MEFSTKADIEAPTDYVFDCLSDFQSFEKAALRRGADVRRVDDGVALGLGAQWRAEFGFRGKTRDVTVELTEFLPPELATYKAVGQGVEATMRIELLSLSNNLTRMTTSVTLEAKTLSARLLLQSLKLAKGQIAKRFDGLMADYAGQLEKRHAKIG